MAIQSRPGSLPQRNSVISTRMPVVAIAGKPAPTVAPDRAMVSGAPARASGAVDGVPAPAGGAIGRFFHNALKWLLTPYLNYVAGRGQARFMHPTHENDEATPADLGMKGQKLSFKSGDGTPLSGWYIPADKPTDKTIVLAHGHGSNMGSMLKKYAKFLHDAGYNIVCFDFRNSGSSGGTQTTLGYDERGDLHAAIDQAVALGGKQVGVLGESMGASTAIEEAADDPRVKALVADCPFDTLYDAILPRVKASTTDVGPLKNVHYPFPKMASEAILQRVTEVAHEPLTSVDPLRLMPKLADRDVLLIHGAADDETPPDCSQRLYDADPGTNKQLFFVPGAKHAQSHEVDPKDYERKALATFAQGLA